jgi:2-aminoadipate transaminase
MAAPEEIIQKVYICKQALDLCPPVFDQYLAFNWMSSGRLDTNLEKAKALYRSKRDILLDELGKEMPSGATWTHPQGGLFIFVTLPEGCDTLSMYDQAISSGIAYVPGSFFFTDGSHRNTMRLNFSYIDSDKIGPAVKLLAAFVRKMMGND